MPLGLAQISYNLVNYQLNMKKIALINNKSLISFFLINPSMIYYGFVFPLMFFKRRNISFHIVSLSSFLHCVCISKNNLFSVQIFGMHMAHHYLPWFFPVGCWSQSLAPRRGSHIWRPYGTPGERKLIHW